MKQQDTPKLHRNLLRIVLQARIEGLAQNATNFRLGFPCARHRSTYLRSLVRLGRAPCVSIPTKQQKNVRAQKERVRRRREHNVNHTEKILQMVTANFASLDILDIERLANGNHHTRRILIERRLAPEWDKDGTFRSHLRYVPRSFLDTHPILWRLPGRFAKRLYQQRPTTSEAMISFVASKILKCVEVSILRHPEKTRERVINSAVRRTQGMFAIIEAIGHARAFYAQVAS